MGIDLGDQKSGAGTLDEQGQVVTHSRWVSGVLQRCGQEVLVAGARPRAAIANSNAKIGQRDARRRAQLVRADPRLLSPIEHRSEELQRDWTPIHQRDNLVETRTRLSARVRGVLKAGGARLPECPTGNFLQQAAEAIPEPLRAAPAPEVIDQVNERICVCAAGPTGGRAAGGLRGEVVGPTNRLGLWACIACVGPCATRRKATPARSSLSRVRKPHARFERGLLKTGWLL